MSTLTYRILAPQDREPLERYLSGRIESSMFLIGNMRAAGLLDQNKTYQGTYYAQIRDGEIEGVMAHFWNGVIITQAAHETDRLAMEVARLSNRAITGVIGPSRQVITIRKTLQLNNQKIKLDEPEKLYGLQINNMSVPAQLRAGEVTGRLMESRDVGLICDWSNAYAQEVLGDIDSEALRHSCRLETERYLTEKRTWILEKETIPVARSSFNARIKEAVQIGGVWTPPELRGNGYGRAVVAASLLEALKSGISRAILFTGETNDTARRVYESLGFQEIEDFHILLLREK